MNSLGCCLLQKALFVFFAVIVAVNDLQKEAG